MNKQERWSLA